MTKCTFVTYSGLPDLDPDDRRVLEILRERGWDCQAAVWDAPDVDWSKAGVVVVRSTWDYNLKYAKFIEWVDHVSQVAQLFNRPNYIRWNSHKGYLRDLSAAGIPIVPTHWFERKAGAGVETGLDARCGTKRPASPVASSGNGGASGGIRPEWSDATSENDGTKIPGSCAPESGSASGGKTITEADVVETELRRLLDAESSGKIIVKPAVGLATSGVMLVEEANFSEAVAHVHKLLEEFDVMVQPFIASVRDPGERALTFVNGRYCHAAQKAPFQKLAAAGHAGEKPVEATVRELELAENVMGVIGELVRKHDSGDKLSDEDPYLPPPLYARVDIVRGDNGEPLVIELELVEPSLFMGFYPLTADFFADAVENLLKRYEKLEQAKL